MDDVEPYYTDMLLIKSLLTQNPDQKIIYDVRNTWGLIDAISENGGRPILSRVGHSFIKKLMREEDAFFAAESSGHTFFRDFYYCDSGLLPLLYMLQILNSSGKSLQQLITPYLEKYFISGEINFQAGNSEEIFQALENQFSDATGLDHFDKLTIEFDRSWRANFRTSNTENLFRLNIEAKNPELLAQKTTELTDIINQLAKP